MCLCVCQPLFQRVLPVISQLDHQGGREDLQSSAQRSSLQDPRKRKLITSVYLLPELLTTLSNLPCLFPWFFMLPPPNLFPTADLQQTCGRTECPIVFECGSRTRWGGVGKPASNGVNSVFKPGGCHIRKSPAALKAENSGLLRTFTWILVGEISRKKAVARFPE